MPTSWESLLYFNSCNPLVPVPKHLSDRNPNPQHETQQFSSISPSPIPLSVHILLPCSLNRDLFGNPLFGRDSQWSLWTIVSARTAGRDPPDHVVHLAPVDDSPFSAIESSQARWISMSTSEPVPESMPFSVIPGGKGLLPQWQGLPELQPGWLYLTHCVCQSLSTDTLFCRITTILLLTWVELGTPGSLVSSVLPSPQWGRVFSLCGEEGWFSAALHWLPWF